MHTTCYIQTHTHTCIYIYIYIYIYSSHLRNLTDKDDVACSELGAGRLVGIQVFPKLRNASFDIQHALGTACKIVHSVLFLLSFVPLQ